MESAFIHVPELHARWLAHQANPILQKFAFEPMILSPRPQWHGRQCRVLGVCETYAAIRFDDMGRYDYWLVKPQDLRMGTEDVRRTDDKTEHPHD